MNRRGFFAALSGFALDPERLLWTPGKKLISIPKPRFKVYTELSEVPLSIESLADVYAMLNEWARTGKVTVVIHDIPDRTFFTASVTSPQTYSLDSSIPTHR